MLDSVRHTLYYIKETQSARHDYTVQCNLSNKALVSVLMLGYQFTLTFSKADSKSGFKDAHLGEI